jgi:hypothetical protein
MTAENEPASPPAETTLPTAVGLLANSSQDEAIDAVVYDVHPAVASSGDYPYCVPNPTAESTFVIGPQDLYQPAPLFRFSAPAPAEYKVPQRFGISAILGVMTALAILFGGFRLLNAEPVVYLFFGVLSLVICLVQMINGKAPRAASVLAGGILAPLFAVQLIDAAGFHVPRSFGGRAALTFVMLPLTAPMGAFLGYLTGTCAAGIFLVMDYLEPYLQGSAIGSITQSKPTP